MVELEGGDEVHKPLRTLAMGLVVPLLMVTLGACGSDKDAEPGTGAASDRAGAHGDAYCSSLKDAGWQVVMHDFMALNDPAEFAALRTNIRTFENSAPVEVKAAWSVLGEDHDRFTKLMDGAGLSIDEVLYWDDNGKPPATVDPKQFEEFFRKLTALDYSKVDAATDTIVAHAKTECDIDLRPE